MRSKKRSKRVVVLDMIISGIKSGKTPAQISKEENIPKQNLQYFLTLLKKKGVLRKVSYGVWKVNEKEVQLSTKEASPPRDHHKTRGHAFIWKIRLGRQISWSKRLKFLGKTFSCVGIKSTPRIVLKGRKIWLTKRGMVIYEPRSFYAVNSIGAKGKAVYAMDQIVKAVLKYVDLEPMKYKFTTSREHFGLFNNELARQYNSKGKKLFVHRADGTAWMWIDDSYALGELENDEMLINKNVQDWYNDHKKHKFEVTPSFLMESLHKLTENQMSLQQTVNNLRTPPKVRDEIIPSYIM